MSYADEVFKQNCRDILAHGVWDTDQNVRPHWADGTPAHTVKKFGIINRYDLQQGISHPDPAADILQDLHRRAAVDLAEEIQQYPRPAGQHLGQLGRRKRLHRQGLRLSAGGEAPVPGG